MKKFSLKPMFSLLFACISVFAFSQNMDAVVYTESDALIHKDVAKEMPVVSTNLNDVLAEVNDYLKNSMKAPEMLDFYNKDMVVMASFIITEKGEIKNISISKKSDKLLGNAVMKELNKLSKTTPVMEDGKAVEKYINVPIVFEIN